MKNFVITVLLSVFFAAGCFGEGEVKSLRQYEHWDNGTIRSCTLFDTNGVLKAKSFCRSDGTVDKVEKYDPSGNRIEEAFYDEKGKLRIGIDGWAAMRWWYTGSHLDSQISYDETGMPMERARAVNSVEYSVQTPYMFSFTQTASFSCPTMSSWYFMFLFT